MACKHGNLGYKCPECAVEEDWAVAPDPHRGRLKSMAALPVPAIERQTLAAYDASDRHIPDSDLDDEQPITLLVSTTLGEVRRIRRAHAMIAEGARLRAEDDRARIAYEDSL